MSDSASGNSSDPFLKLSFITRDTWLSAALVETLGFGIYTAIYFFTMVVTVTNAKFRKPHKFLNLAISFLYLLITLHFAIEWYELRQMFVIFGDTSQDIVDYLYVNAPFWINMTTVTLYFTATVVADAILVWRCLVIWDYDWYVTVLPIASYLAEFVMAIVGLAAEAAPITIWTVKSDPGSVYLGLSLATTVLCTVLIVYRIIRLGLFSSEAPYRSVIEIVCESAALYSISLIIFIPMFVSQDTTINFGSEYLKRMVLIITGAAPTLIVARVAVGIGRPTESWSQPIQISIIPQSTKFSSVVDTDSGVLVTKSKTEVSTSSEEYYV